MVRMGGATGTRTICPTGGVNGGREQPMISLSRSLKRLEAGCRQNVDDRCRIIQQESFKHLSIDQKKCLLAAMTSYQHRPLTSEEGAVVRAFDTATKEEGRKAGITVAEFLRYRRQATQP